MEGVAAAILELLLGRSGLASERRCLAVWVIGTLVGLGLRCIEKVLAHRLSSESSAHDPGANALQRVGRVVDPVLWQIDLHAIATIQQIVACIVAHIYVLAPQ